MSGNDFDTDIGQEIEQALEPDAPETPDAPDADEPATQKQPDRKKLALAAGAAALLFAGGLALLKPSAPPEPGMLAPPPSEAMAPTAIPVGDVPPPMPAADPLAWNGEPPSAPAEQQPEMIPPPPPPADVPAADPFPPAPGEMAAAPPLPPADVPVPVAEAPVPAPAPQAEAVPKAVDERLAAMEQAVFALQSQAVTRADIEALQVAIGKLQQDLEQKKPEQKAEARAPEKKAKARPRSSWVMKSAKPGIAWVAEKGSRELRTVSVGDDLPGIGRITEITKDSMGSWVIVGEEGKISQ